MTQLSIVFLALSAMLVARFGINGAVFVVRNRAGWLWARIQYHYWMTLHRCIGLSLAILNSRLVEKMFTSHLAHRMFGRIKAVEK
jgi:hypothetical protein